VQLSPQVSAICSPESCASEPSQVSVTRVFSVRGFISPLGDMSAWLDQVFEAGQVAKGGVVRRSVKDVQKYSSEEALIEEAKERGFHVVQTGDQYVILCHPGALKIHT
jgi:hypothetical protein